MRIFFFLLLYDLTLIWSLIIRLICRAIIRLILPLLHFSYGALNASEAQELLLWPLLLRSFVLTSRFLTALFFCFHVQWFLFRCLHGRLPLSITFRLKSGRLLWRAAREEGKESSTLLFRTRILLFIRIIMKWFLFILNSRFFRLICLWIIIRFRLFLRWSVIRLSVKGDFFPLTFHIIFL